MFHPIKLGPLDRGRQGTISALCRSVRSQVATPSRLEAGCLGIGMFGAVLALGVTVAQATLAPPLPSHDSLRDIAARAGAELCPDGWAAEHASRLGATESEVMAWYLREALTVPDDALIATVGLHLSSAGSGDGDARAHAETQILLCIAESRRLTQPAETLVHPELRDA
jgi:hypothetical protein